MKTVYETVNYKDLYKRAEELVSAKKSFSVIELNGKMREAITVLVNAIGKAGLRSRVYTSKRGIMATAGIIGGIALGGACPVIGIPLFVGGLATGGTKIAHDVGTFNPDYEIEKHLFGRQLTVTYKKKQ